MRTLYRRKPILIAKSEAKLTATRVVSRDILFLVKPLVLLLEVDGAISTPVYCSINRLFHPPEPLRNPSRFITIRHSPQHW
jgi:hypothetical protein